MRLCKIGTVMQGIFFVGCLVVFVCMPLYTAFYTTTFGEVCFKIGAIFTVGSVFNPLGLIGSILNLIGCSMIDLKSKKQKAALVWTLVSPILVILLYLLTIHVFLGHSGGV